MIEKALGLHIGEMQAETHVCAAAVGHPSVLVPRSRLFVRKTHRIKLERFRPKFRHAVSEHGADDNARAGWNVMTLEVEVAHGGAWYAWHRWIDAHGFLEGHLEQREFAEPFVRKRGTGRETETAHLL